MFLPPWWRTVTVPLLLPEFLGNIVNELSYYEPIYNGLESTMRDRMKDFLAELGTDIQGVPTDLIYRDLIFASQVEATKNGIVPHGNSVRLANEFNNVIDRWKEEGNSYPSERNLILSLAYEGKASTLLLKNFGLDEKKMEQLTAQNLSKFTVEELTQPERNLIPEEQEYAAGQFVDANFEGMLVQMKGNKRAMFQMLLMGAMTGIPMAGGGLDFGSWNEADKAQRGIRE